ncbi:MAG: hypothetical protein V4579_06625 [Pseudomonadota bacterium]
MSDKQTRKPIDLKSDNPSQNSRTHAATSIQSVVEPEDYPTAERDAQVEAATGRPAAKTRKNVRR